MADIRSSQLVSQIEWQVAGKIKAFQVLCQVEYTVPEAGTYTGNIIIEVTPESDSFSEHLYTGDITTSFIPESETGTGTTYYGEIPTTFTIESTYFKESVYTGDLTVSLVPEAEIVGDYAYNGLIQLNVTPESAYRMPIPGFDWWTGYGLVDLTFLDGDPPYYCFKGQIDASVSFDSIDSGYAEYALIGSGGLEISGEGIFAFEKPVVYSETGSGGFKASGTGTVVFTTPSVYTVIAVGEANIGGEGVVAFVEAPVIPEYAVVGSGGLIVKGLGTFAFTKPPVPYMVTAVGGIKLNGEGTVDFVDVSEITYTVIGGGGVSVGGEGDKAFIIVDDVFFLVATGGINLGGAGLITKLSPEYFSLVGSGGVIISGEGTDEEFIYQTWVFTGAKLSPSIYSGYDFNSYCEYNGKYYGCNDQGVFELTGDTDNGAAIHTGIKIGATNFGSLFKKRLRTIYVGAHNEETQIKVEFGREDLVLSGEFETNRGKANITRNLYGEEMTLYVSDFNELSTIELFVNFLNARGF